MSRVTIDDEMIKRLAGTGKTTLLCDTSGKVVGILAPNNQPQLQPQISEEEFEKRLREDRRYSTAEVLKYLESL
jgi:hypothetical protein